MNYTEINIVGFSHGGILSRSVVERCEGIPKVHTLFTFGGPHGGLHSVRKCDSTLCRVFNRAFGYFANSKAAQYIFAPADYYRGWW